MGVHNASLLQKLAIERRYMMNFYGKTVAGAPPPLVYADHAGATLAGRSQLEAAMREMEAARATFEAKAQAVSDELAALQAEPPQWLKDLRKNGPHPKNLVAAKLGVSIAGLARGGPLHAHKAGPHHRTVAGNSLTSRLDPACHQVSPLSPPCSPPSVMPGPPSRRAARRPPRGGHGAPWRRRGAVAAQRPPAAPGAAPRGAPPAAPPAR